MGSLYHGREAPSRSMIPPAHFDKTPPPNNQLAKTAS